MPSLGLAVLLTLSQGTTPPAPSATDAALLESRIDRIVKGVAGRSTPGIAVVVTQGERTLYRKASGFADLEGKVQMTTATPMRIASLSKAFTAAVIQGLAADGKLKLDDPIAPYFPAAPEPWAKVTIRQLLNQISGIPDYTGDQTFEAGFVNPGGPDQVVAWATPKPLDFEPGTKFEYSNTNYVLLGLIAEKAGGAPLETQLGTRIFGPLGMTSAKLPRSGGPTPGEAAGSIKRAGRLVPARAIDMGWPYASGAIVASADDMALWLGGIAGAKALTEAQRAEAFTPAKLGNGELSFYGFGWILGTRGMAPMISHGGGIDGFSSYVAYLPATDVRLVILANSQDADTYRLASPILDAVEGKEPALGIEDKDPTLTARLRAVVDKMLKGERDPAEFDPEFLKAVPDDVYATTGKSLGELGEVAEFELTKDTKTPSGRVREYRLTLGAATLTALFSIGADGKINGLRLK